MQEIINENGRRVIIPDRTVRVVFSNVFRVSFTPRSMILDFLSVHPGGTVAQFESSIEIIADDLQVFQKVLACLDNVKLIKHGNISFSEASAQVAKELFKPPQPENNPDDD